MEESKHQRLSVDAVNRSRGFIRKAVAWRRNTFSQVYSLATVEQELSMRSFVLSVGASAICLSPPAASAQPLASRPTAATIATAVAHEPPRTTTNPPRTHHCT